VLSQDRVVFLFDVDNTLLDNDRFRTDLGDRLQQAFGSDQRDRYWAILTALREELSYVDYLAALQKFRDGLEDRHELLQISSFVLDYPFASRLYPRALEAVAHLAGFGLPVVLSDGDIVFQPRKIQRSGIWSAVQGRVLIDVHKERALEAMRSSYPARHYVMIDDKAAVLIAMKRVMGDMLTTVFVHQGHYAAEFLATPPGAPTGALDLEIDTIADLLDCDPGDLAVASPADAPVTTKERT
jgi:FMN phosphatase YigB (HAD superfamily)